MKYLDAVLKEGKFFPSYLDVCPLICALLQVLRLYPSVPINSRTATFTTTLPTGGGPHGTSPVLIRKGEAVGYAPYVMHRRREIFGPDAEAFRPERWLENGGRLFSTVGFGYVPFNGGPRMCLGRESHDECETPQARMLLTIDRGIRFIGSRVRSGASTTAVFEPQLTHG